MFLPQALCGNQALLNANVLLTLTTSCHLKSTGQEAEDYAPGPWAAIASCDLKNVLGPPHLLGFVLFSLTHPVS